MGTLFNQPERNNHAVSASKLQDFLDFVVEVSHSTKLSPKLVIEAARVLEMRRSNDLRLSNGDIFDEQMEGFGEVLQQIAHALKDKES